jgi:hypothetical protein
LAEAGATERADSCYRVSLAVFDGLGDGSIFPPWTRMNYANLCRDEGRAAEAEVLYLRAEAELDSTNAGMRPYVGQCLIDHGYLRSLQGRHEEAEAMMRAGFALRGPEPSASDRELGGLFLLWASARARAGDPAGAGEKMGLAEQCGTTAADGARYPELAALGTGEGQPPASSP